MSTTQSGAAPSREAIEEFQRIRSAISVPQLARRLWTRSLTLEHRRRLGGDLNTAFEKHGGTPGMWQELHGVARHVAVVEVARAVGLLDEEGRQWLLREMGERSDPQEALDQAIAAGDLVLVERPQAAHWQKEEIDGNWNKNLASWDFLWLLSRKAKAGGFVDRFMFGEHAHADVVAKKKARLLQLPGFPVDLGDAIEPVGTGSQQLMIPREQIHVFEIGEIDAVREWRPS